MLPEIVRTGCGLHHAVSQGVLCTVCRLKLWPERKKKNIFIYLTEQNFALFFFHKQAEQCHCSKIFKRIIFFTLNKISPLDKTWFIPHWGNSIIYCLSYKPRFCKLAVLVPTEWHQFWITKSCLFLVSYSIFDSKMTHHTGIKHALPDCSLEIKWHQTGCMTSTH